MPCKTASLAESMSLPIDISTHGWQVTMQGMNMHMTKQPWWLQSQAFTLLGFKVHMNKAALVAPDTTHHPARAQHV